MMSRPIKYSREEIIELLYVKATDGIPLEVQCEKKDWKYISVNRAMKRYNLKNPKKFALREGRKVMGKLIYAPVDFSKNEEKSDLVEWWREKQTEASE
jgi:hypothetical protein